MLQFTTVLGRLSVPLAPSRLLRLAFRWLVGIGERRAQRRALAKLDRRLLRDIGLDRQTADKESRKVF